MNLKTNRPSKGPLANKSFVFSIEIVQVCKFLMDNKEFVLSKQLIRSGTAIGALTREAHAAQSKKDFIHKLHIAFKEASETIYWIDLLYETDFLNRGQYDSLSHKAEELYKILSSSILTSKSRRN